MGYLKRCGKKKKKKIGLFTNVDSDSLPPFYSNQIKPGWIQVRCFIARQNEVILGGKKRHDKVELVLHL